MRLLIIIQNNKFLNNINEFLDFQIFKLFWVDAKFSDYLIYNLPIPLVL